jgi:hypothetical protein
MATPLYPRLKKSVFDEMHQIHKAQLHPWRMFHAGLSVKRLDGTEIRYEGIEFKGSPRQIFWSSYIEPFLKEMVLRQYTSSIKIALEREVDAREVLLEVRDLMLSVGRKTYREMATIDQRLQSKGDLNLIPLRNCDNENERFGKFVDEHYQAELVMLKQPSRLEKWYARNKALVWIGGLLTAALGALAKVIGI